MMAVLAESPVALEGYLAVQGALATSSLSTAEQHFLALAISVDNGCTYCVPAYSMMAAKSGTPQQAVDAVRDGQPIDDGRLSALRDFTRAVVEKRGRVAEEVIFLSALDEERMSIAQANAVLDDDGRFVAERVSARKQGEFEMVAADEIDMMDVSPNQLVSVAASLIPFLENDDANRALMGSNMMRQAVPLLRTQAPLVGTGMESVVARDSGVTVVAKRDCAVESVDASRIVLKPLDQGIGESNVDIINLIKYQRSNQNTCINQRPIMA